MFSSFFSKNKRVTVGLLYTKRSVLKRAIQQCKIQWNTILNEGAKDNRMRKFERKVTFFLSFLGFSRKLR
jgi:hypothetical protein